MMVDATNISVTLSWDNPGGHVDSYLIVVTHSRLGTTFNLTVGGNLTMHILMNLDPATTYEVHIFTINSNGRSMASPLLSIDTDGEYTYEFSPLP